MIGINLLRQISYWDVQKCCYMIMISILRNIQYYMSIKIVSIYIIYNS